MYQILFALVNDPLGLPLAAAWEYGILAVMAVVAFLLGSEISLGEAGDNMARWTARLVVFAALWATAYALIVLFRWIVSNWLLTMGLVAVGVIAVYAIYVMIRYWMFRV